MVVGGAVFHECTIGHVALAIDAEDRRLVEAFDDVPETVDDDLMRDDEDASIRVIDLDFIEHAAQSQDDIAPRFAAGRPEVKLANRSALRGEIGKSGADAANRITVEHAEFLFAKPLVDMDAFALQSERVAQRRAGFDGARERRGHEALRSQFGRLRGEPRSQRVGLPPSEIGQRDIRVAARELDQVVAGLFGGVPRNIACTLSVADDPEACGKRR